MRQKKTKIKRLDVSQSMTQAISLPGLASVLKQYPHLLELRCNIAMLSSGSESRIAMSKVKEFKIAGPSSRANGTVTDFIALSNGNLATAHHYVEGHFEIRIWDIDQGRCVRTLSLKVASGHGAVFYTALPDERFAIGSANNHSISILDLKNGACQILAWPVTASVPGFGATSIYVLPDGYLAECTGHDKSLRIWDIKTGTCIQTLFSPFFDKAHKNNMFLELLPDGLIACARVNGNHIQIWDINKALHMHTLSGACDLILMSNLPKTGPERGKIYLSKEGSRLKYVIINTQKGELIEDFLDINIAELTKESLDENKRTIFKEISKRIHIPEGMLYSEGSRLQEILCLPDGRLVSVSSLGSFEGRHAGSLNNIVISNINLWDVKNGVCLQVLNTFASIGNSDVSRDDRLILLPDTDGYIGINKYGKFGYCDLETGSSAEICSKEVIKSYFKKKAGLTNKRLAISPIKPSIEDEMAVIVELSFLPPPIVLISPQTLSLSFRHYFQRSGFITESITGILILTLKDTHKYVQVKLEKIWADCQRFIAICCGWQDNLEEKMWLNLKNTSLYIACPASIHQALLELLEAIIVPPTLSKVSMTLHHIVTENKKAVVEELLEQGALLEQLNTDGDTALLVAIRCGFLPIVDILLRHGARLEFQNSKGETAESLAKQLKNQDLLDYFAKNRYLFARTAGGTALHKSVAKGDEAEVSDLLQKGAYVNALNYKGESALHVLAQKAAVLANAEALAQLLIKAGIDLTLVDDNGSRAVQRIPNPYSAQKLTTLLLEQRNIISMRRIKALIHGCSLRYVGDFESREADKKLLDQTITHLSGKIHYRTVAELMQRYMLTYMGHLISLEGTYSQSSHNIKDEDFEGFWQEIFLVLRARVLLEIIVRTEKGLLLDAPCSKEESLVRLVSEFFYIVQMLHSRLDLCFVRSQSDWAIQAHIKHVTKQIMALNPGSIYGYAGGWERHAIYIELERRADSPQKLLVKIHNLGQGYKIRDHGTKKTPFKHKPTENGDKVLPYVFEIPLTEEAISIYIEQMVKANLVPFNKGSPLLYDTDQNVPGKTILPPSELEKRFAWRRAQTVGNCSVKNAQPGLQTRWQTGDPAKKESHKFYHYFREKEPQFIPIKSYLSVAAFTCGFGIPDFGKDSAAAGVEELIGLELAKEIIYEARKQGYTDLHLAVITGDLDKAREEIQEGAKPENTTSNGYNALHLAVLHNQLAVANYLLSIAKEPELLTQAVTNQGDSLLHLAMRQSEEEKAQTLDFIFSHQIMITPTENAQGISPQDEFRLMVQRDHQLNSKVVELSTHLEEERRAQQLLRKEIEDMHQRYMKQEQCLEHVSQTLRESTQQREALEKRELENAHSKAQLTKELSELRAEQERIQEQHKKIEVEQLKTIQDMYRELDALKEAIPKPITESAPVPGIYGFWQKNKKSILLGMTATAAGLAVLTQVYQENDAESKSSIGLQKH